MAVPRMENQLNQPLHEALTNGNLEKLTILAKRFTMNLQVLKEASFTIFNYLQQGRPITPIQASVMVGNYQLCKQLIREKGSFNSTVFNIPPPLIMALETDKFQVARLLISSGAAAPPFNNRTLMFTALKKNTPEFIIEELLKAGCPIDAAIEEKHGMTTLHRAVALDNVPVVKALIRNNANVNVRDALQYTPLHVAVNHNFIHLVSILADSNADLEAECKEGYTPLFHAILNNNTKIVKLLVKLGADVLHLSSVKMIYPLNFAASLGRRSIAEQLVKRGAGVLVESPETGNLPIHDVASSPVGKRIDSIKEDLAKIAEMLIENGSEIEIVNKKGLSPMQLAIREFNFNIVEVLVKEGVNPNKEIDAATTFHFVSKFANGDVIKTFLDWGADWSLRDKNGLSAYHWAKVNAISGVLQVFLKFGCPLDLKIVSGENSLTFLYSNEVLSVLKNQNDFLLGVRRGDVNLMRHAMQDGAHVRGVSQETPFPLHFAVENGFHDAVLLLLENGACVNTFDNNGETPLHIAARNGHFKICIYLLSFGACVSVFNKGKEKTPLDCAMENNNFRVVFLLKEIQTMFSNPQDEDVEFLEKKLSSWQTGPRLLLAFINCINSRGETLMALALRKGLMTLAESIMRYRLGNDEADVFSQPLAPRKTAKRGKRFAPIKAIQM